MKTCKDGIIGTFDGIPFAYCKCGGVPEIVETYDTLQIVCKSMRFIKHQIFWRLL